MTPQKPCPADSSTTRPWTPLEAAYADDGNCWGPFTCEAYRDLERRKKAFMEQWKQIQIEWNVMLDLEAKVKHEIGLREASEAMQRGTGPRI